jgi:hypothetical protein
MIIVGQITFGPVTLNWSNTGQVILFQLPVVAKISKGTVAVADILAKTFKLYQSLQLSIFTFEIIGDDAPWRVGRDRFSEMLFEGVVRELEALLRRVGPQVVVHAAVHRLTKLVGA